MNAWAWRTLIAEHLSDCRQGLNRQFSLADLLRQSVYSRLAGYEDLNDAVRVSADPTFRLIGSPKMWDRGAALTSTLHWFETELLTQEDESRRANGREPGGACTGRDGNARPTGSCSTWIRARVRCMGRRKGAPTTGTSSPSATTRCFCSMNMATASVRRCGPGTCIAPTIGATCSCRKLTGSRRRVRAWRSALTPRLPYKSFRYQAKSWTTPRRIVAKVEHHQGELFPRVGFIVTNMTLPSRSVVRFYNKRGTAEQWIKEGKQATPDFRFRCGTVRLGQSSAP